MTSLASVLIHLARHGQARCGAGFGNYPLGIRYAITQLITLVDEEDAKEVAEAVKAFNKRLEE